jgi:hypothetical protein
VGLTIHDEILYVTGERTNNVVGLDLGSGNVHLVAGDAACRPAGWCHHPRSPNRILGDAE